MGRLDLPRLRLTDVDQRALDVGSSALLLLVLPPLAEDRLDPYLGTEPVSRTETESRRSAAG